MKTSPIRIALIATTLVFATAGTANAAGCLKGAVVVGREHVHAAVGVLPVGEPDVPLRPELQDAELDHAFAPFSSSPPALAMNGSFLSPPSSPPSSSCAIAPATSAFS